MTDKIKIKLYCTTGLIGFDHVEYVEEDREAWEAKSAWEREDILQEYAEKFLSRHIDYGAYVVEGEGK